MGFLKDEKGKNSSGRLAFWISFGWIILFVTLEMVRSIEKISAGAYGLMQLLLSTGKRAGKLLQPPSK